MFRARPGLATRTVSEVDVAHYQGITLAGELLGTRAEVADLSVQVDAAGLTIAGPAAGVTRTVPWDRVSSIFTRPGMIGTKSQATALEVGFEERAVEFLFPSEAYSPESILELMHHTTIVSGLTVASTIDFDNLPDQQEPKEITKEPAPSRSEKRAEAQAKAKAATKAQRPAKARRPAKGKAPAVAQAVAEAQAQAVAEAPAPASTPQVPTRPRRGRAKAQIAPVKAGAAPKAQRAVKAPAPSKKAVTPSKVKAQPTIAAHKDGRSAAQVTRQANGLLALAVVLVFVVAGLGAFFYRDVYRVTASPAATRSLVTNTALAANIGLSPTSLSKWTSSSANPGNPFASGAARSAAAKQTAARAGARLAQCLRVPVADVDGAFGIGSALGGGATAQSLLLSQSVGSATTASSSVAVLGSDAEVGRDMSVFADSTLFASCDASYVQSMLPYAATGLAGVTFSTASVQPEAVFGPSTSARVHVKEFRISRTANLSGQAVTIRTDAFEIYGGKVQATVTTTSSSVFDSDTETSLVGGVEAKVAGDLGR